LGIYISASEAEVHWREFFSSLIKRGLQGVERIISDAHEGLKAARKKVFSGVKWQRCQFHLLQNALAYVLKIGRRKEVDSVIRAVFKATKDNEAQRFRNMDVEKYKQAAHKLSQWMEINIPEGLAVLQFPEEHRKKIRTTNGL
jgi:transposase-like protein